MAPPKGHPVRVRLAVLGEHLIAEVDVDLDGADLLAAHLDQLVRLAQPNG